MSLSKGVVFHRGRRCLGLSLADQNEDCPRHSPGRSLLPAPCAERGKRSGEEPVGIWAVTACLDNLCRDQMNFWLCVGWCSTFWERFPICNCANRVAFFSPRFLHLCCYWHVTEKETRVQRSCVAGPRAIMTRTMAECGFSPSQIHRAE